MEAGSMSERIPVTPDTAWAFWPLHALHGLRPATSHGEWVLEAEVIGSPRAAHQYIYPATGIKAVGVERDGDGWCWVVDGPSGDSR
jgi:hypothetical protein